VTIALQAFESKGLIEKTRGSITVMDRGGLEESANGLYGPPESEYERLFAQGARSKSFNQVAPAQQ
jgi:hypothetical protein